MSTMPSIRREVLVDADPATAFDVFTTRLGRWWPLATHSVHGVHGLNGFNAVFAYLPPRHITIAVTTTLGPRSISGHNYSTDLTRQIARYLAPGHPIS